MNDGAIRIGIVAGELSGDQIGAALIRRVIRKNPDVEFIGVAGPQMRKAGCQAVAETEDLSVMGFAEVLLRLPRLLRLRRRLVHFFRSRPPRLFIGIDAPDFNLGLEKQLRSTGISTVHWVSPSVWAWRRYRLKKIRKSTDHVLTLFPFEADFYKQHRVKACFMGHPMADEIDRVPQAESVRMRQGMDVQRPCIALLPGSREAEVNRLLPEFLKAALLCSRALPSLQFVLPVASPRLKVMCNRFLARPEYAGLEVLVLDGMARTAISASDAVLVASGTATLECMLLERPMVVAYKLNAVSFRLIHPMLNVPHVSLPNNLLNRCQVPEFLQAKASAENLSAAVLNLIQHPAEAERQIAPFSAVRETLKQDAAGRVADFVLDHVQGTERGAYHDVA